MAVREGVTPARLGTEVASGGQGTVGAPLPARVPVTVSAVILVSPAVTDPSSRSNDGTSAGAPGLSELSWAEMRGLEAC